MVEIVKVKEILETPLKLHKKSLTIDDNYMCISHTNSRISKS